MGLIANPWVILAAVIAFGAIVGGAAYQGYQMGKDSVIAAQAREKAATDAAIAALINAGAREIAVIHSKSQPAKERVIREITHDRIYVDCKSDPSVMHEYNTLVGAPNPAGDIGVHKTDADH